MNRCTFKNKGLEIAYGYDRPLQGYFITIYNPKYLWSVNKSDEDNAIANIIDPSGEGIIASLTTTRNLGGLTASHQHLSITLSNLGCPNEEHILAVFNNKEI